MKNNKISNPKKEVPKGILLNDQDYMAILLSNLKCLTKDMAVALTECSNANLYKKYQGMFDNIVKHQRAAYELMFKFGWYTLEKSEDKKVSTLADELNTQFQDLNLN